MQNQSTIKNKFKKIGIIFNPSIKKSQENAKILSEKFEFCEIFSIDEMKKNIDLAITVGGDGTFLKASRFYCNHSIPTLGFNLGRLGYLAQAKIEEVENVIEKINNNDFIIEERLMLKSACDSENIEKYTALNDIVVKGVNCARSATFILQINNKEICSYVADGLIVSTPTGSTAYSLSAGGPVISPDVDCFLIIPICPHTLNTRPLIVPKDEKIIIKTLENQRLNVSFDGQIDIVLDNKIEIEKNENYAKLLILNKQKDKFYDILKEKLHWSISIHK